MARFCDNGASQYLMVNTAVITGTPWSVSCWCWPLVDNLGHSITLRKNSSYFFTMHFRSKSAGSNPGALRVAARWPTYQSANTTGTWTTGACNHATGFFENDSSRSAVLNGGAKATDSGSSGTPSGIVQTGVNYSPNGGAAGNAYWGEVAIWDVALTGAERAALAECFSPLCIRPHNLRECWSLIRDDQGIINGFDLTPYNSPTVVAHCPIIYPGRPQTAERDRRIPRMMHYYRQRRVA